MRSFTTNTSLGLSVLLGVTFGGCSAEEPAQSRGAAGTGGSGYSTHGGAGGTSSAGGGARRDAVADAIDAPELSQLDAANMDMSRAESGAEVLKGFLVGDGPFMQYPYDGGFVFIPGRTPVGVHGQLRIEGNKFVDPNNYIVTLRGMSMYDWGDKGKQFYTAATVKRLAEDWGCTVLRIPILPENYRETKPGNFPPAMTRLKTVVDACIDNGIYAIIDWHSMNASNADNASAFFTEMAKAYGNTPNVMYELWNEPVDESWPVIKAYHEKVITAIRAVDPDNIILCGSRYYDQRTDEPAQDPITLSQNIAYTFHFYAYTHPLERFGKDVTTALTKGLAIFSTEYAGCRSDGNGPYDFAELRKWWDYLDANNIGSANWALETNAETASVFMASVDKNVTGPWSDAELTQPGKDVKAYIQSKYNETVMAP